MSSSICRRAVPPLLLVLALLVAACGVAGPRDLGDLRVNVTNRSERPVDVGATIAGDGISGDGTATIDPKGGGELISRLAPTWAITIGGRPFLSSAIRPDLALVPGAPRRDLVIEIDVDPAGTVSLKGAHFADAGRPAGGG